MISETPKTVHWTLSAVAAAAITLLLFGLMHALLGQQAPFITTGPTTEPLNLSLIRPDSKPEEKPKSLPVPPPVSSPPPVARFGSGDEALNPLPIEAPTLPETELPRDMPALTQNKSALPLVRIEPKYPVQAARDGVEGWVRLAFSVNSAGQVTDIQVIDSEPKRLFEREAIRALQQWKYQPQMENGQATIQQGLVVQLDFSLGSR